MKHVAPRASNSSTTRHSKPWRRINQLVVAELVLELDLALELELALAPVLALV